MPDLANRRYIITDINIDGSWDLINRQNIKGFYKDFYNRQVFLQNFIFYLLIFRFYNHNLITITNL